MRRREYCALSKEASQHLLNDILSGEEQDVVIAKVHEYLRDLAQRMRDDKIQTAKYIIYTVSRPGPVSGAQLTSIRNWARTRARTRTRIACRRCKWRCGHWMRAARYASTM
jgi:hypothetical protein